VVSRFDDNFAKTSSGFYRPDVRMFPNLRTLLINGMIRAGNNCLLKLLKFRAYFLAEKLQPAMH